MYRFLALPVVFFVISFINSANSFSGFQYFGFIVTIFSTLLVSISSIGSEGKAIMNLYQFPMGPQDFVVGKGATPIIFGSSVSIAFFAITDILSKTSLLVTAVLSVSAVALTFEIALIGLFFGMKFPNFSELRSSFISPLGGILGFIVSSTLMVISLSPIFYETFFQQVTSNLLIGLVASLAIVVVISFFFFRIVMGQARNLLAQIPT